MENALEEDEWDDYGNDGEWLAKCISLGNNFAMNSKEGNVKGSTSTSWCTQRLFSLSTQFSSAHVGKSSMLVIWQWPKIITKGGVN
jgi:hypothetical protein